MTITAEQPASLADALKASLADAPQCNKDNMRKLVAAARSGEYVQEFGTLRRTRSDGTICHCFIGIACDLAAREGLGTWRQHHEYGWQFITGEDWTTSALPWAVQDWLGLDSRNDWASFIPVADGHAAKMNDGDMDIDSGEDKDGNPVWHVEPMTLSEVADAVERYYQLAEPA